MGPGGSDGAPPGSSGPSRGDSLVAATHYLKARVALMDNDLNKALEKINTAIEPALQHFLSYLGQGFVYMARQEYDRAEVDSAKVISMKPDFPGGYTQRGRALMEQKRVDQAVTDFNRARSLAPDNQETLAYRALAYFLQKNTSRPGRTRPGPRNWGTCSRSSSSRPWGRPARTG
jgi:tetratricopeptide (TPR) repeat protein